MITEWRAMENQPRQCDSWQLDVKSVFSWIFTVKLQRRSLQKSENANRRKTNSMNDFLCIVLGIMLGMFDARLYHLTC